MQTAHHISCAVYYILSSPIYTEVLPTSLTNTLLAVQSTTVYLSPSIRRSSLPVSPIHFQLCSLLQFIFPHLYGGSPYSSHQYPFSCAVYYILFPPIYMEVLHTSPTNRLLAVQPNTFYLSPYIWRSSLPISPIYFYLGSLLHFIFPHIYGGPPYQYHQYTFIWAVYYILSFPIYMEVLPTNLTNTIPAVWPLGSFHTSASSTQTSASICFEQLYQYKQYKSQQQCLLLWMFPCD